MRSESDRYDPSAQGDELQGELLAKNLFTITMLGAALFTAICLFVLVI